MIAHPSPTNARAARLLIALVALAAIAMPATGAASSATYGPLSQSAARTEVLWDDTDSHKWIGEAWGSNAPSALTWGAFHGRDCLEVRWDNDPENPPWLGYVRTDLISSENWESPVVGLRADVWVESAQSWTDIGIEPRNSQDVSIELLFNYNLTTNRWHTLTWTFTAARDYSAVGGLVFKIDQLGNAAARVYIDNLRLVTTTGEEPWDDMNDDSRWWFYGGGWYRWAGGREWGLEPITHRGLNPTTPIGSVFLQWQYRPDIPEPIPYAEVGTDDLSDRPDWSGFNRLTADVKVSDPDVFISPFFWNAEGATTPVDIRGFGAPGRAVGVANTWRTITWDLPWPPSFDNTGIDQFKFIVNNIDVHRTGTVYIDNIRLVSDPLPPPVTGLSYTFEDFDDRNLSFNDFQGNWGELNKDNGDYIDATLDSGVYHGSSGVSLRLDYDLPGSWYAGMWQSLWGHSDYPRQTIDFTDIYGALAGADKDFEQIQFWVRGSGSPGRHNVKVELKDNSSGALVPIAYRYITISDSATWQQVVIDADVTNSDFWSYNNGVPDPTAMKQMVFVIESYFNNSPGTFYIDDITLVDADDAPVDTAALTDDQFLDLVSERTFLHFLDWYDADTGLFFDRSQFPDLMSIAATGFGLTSLAIGESRGWIDRASAVDRVTLTLQTLYECQSPDDTVEDAIANTCGYKGFFYHFLGENGLRKNSDTELSSVDTALLLAGMLTVREYFDDVPEIVNLVDAIYARVDWPWMFDEARNPQAFYMAWKPEDGGQFSEYYWDYYTDETILVDLLAIGSPTHPVPADVFYAFAREQDNYGGHSLIRSWNGSFFIYAFAHLFVDFEPLGADKHPSQPVNWWDNSVEAAWAAWQFAVDHGDTVTCDGDDRFTTYGATAWGLTASDGPEGNACMPESLYCAYGSLPAHEAPKHDGTVQPYGAGMATMFLSGKAIPALKAYFQDSSLWSYRFGFADAYNLDPPECGDPWYNHVGFGIDQGPMLIAIENYRSGLIWDVIETSPYLQRALKAVWSPMALDLGLGWNLITLPREMPGATAQSVLDTINLQDGEEATRECREIVRWLNGGWDAHVDRLPFNDFPAAVGAGYFVRCQAGATWMLGGSRLESGAPIAVGPGWNLIGMPYPPFGYTAQSLLDEINSRDSNPATRECTEINRWEYGGWDGHVDGLPFNDFAVEPEDGYILRCTQPVSFTPSTAD